jgi:microcystin-dependent protein
MSYQVRFTDTTKTAVTVEDQTVNTEKSVSFVGKNFAGYSQIIAENFLHLLENFAKSTAPNSPVAGQLWYNTTVGADNQLKLFDGTGWVAAGNVKKGATAPVTAVIGDLWADTDNKQLYLWNGSGWVLVGPQFSTGLKTGAEVELLAANNEESYPVLSLFVNDQRVAIVSVTDFTPKATIVGYTTIKQGLNISSYNFNNTLTGTKLWGTSEKAEALIVGSATVAATNFLRKDETSTTNYGLNVRNNVGISIGGDLSLTVSIDNNAATIFNKISGSSIDFKLKSGSTTPTVMRINSNAVGINKTNPIESLDVAGNIKTDSSFITTSTDDIGSLSTGSIVSAGGATLAKSLSVGNELFVYNQSNLSDTVPLVSTAQLGTDQNPWYKLYVNELHATSISGTFTGFLTGSISGSATSLVNSTTFSLGDKLDGQGNVVQRSDVVSTGVSFNGSTQTNTVTLTGIISSSFIASKSEATDSYGYDELLISRSGSLKRVSKTNFIKNIPTTPAGAIFPYAGLTAPRGYLFCDGSEVLISSYPDLFQIIGYSYKPISALTGVSTFGLPDLRGRFALGRDDMSNSSTSNPANRNTDVNADIIGNTGGNESITLTKNNLPDHVHDLKSDADEQFYAFAPRNGTPLDTNNAQSANGLTAVGQGQLLVNSGGVFMDNETSPVLGAPINVVNPFQTINYIIFTGKIS